MTIRGSLACVLMVACGGGNPDAKAPAASTAAAAPAEAQATTPAGQDDRAKVPASVTQSKEATRPAEPPITSVRVYVTNGCDKPVAYCVEDGSTLNTQLTQRSSITHTVKPGARILEKTGSSCGSVRLTVPATKDEVKLSICTK